MNPEIPIFEPDEDATYHLDVAARITGISRDTILHYQERGWLRPRIPSATPEVFDPSDLLTLRRIDHLHHTLGVDETALRLILGLLEEIDHLKQDLRRNA